MLISFSPLLWPRRVLVEKDINATGAYILFSLFATRSLVEKDINATGAYILFDLLVKSLAAYWPSSEAPLVGPHVFVPFEEKRFLFIVRYI